MKRLNGLHDRICTLQNIEEADKNARRGKHNSCIKKRGIHKLAQDVKKALITDAEGTIYCLKIGVRKFYPSINHRTMKRLLRRKIKDVYQ